MSKYRGKGLGASIRQEWARGREVPNPQQQMNMFYVGVVMDDVDEQFLGRIWVKIASKSISTYSDSGSARNAPTYGGTTPDRDGANNSNRRLEWEQQLRNGWIRCTPMFPLFGGDDYRNQSASDGDNRNSQNGDVVSYGFWAQPRIGDNVGVLFADGDPSKGYWIGCSPKFDRNFMVPGAPGRAPSDLKEEQLNGQPTHPVTDQFRRNSPDDAIVPALDKTRRVVTANTAADSDGEQTDASKKSIDRELVQVLVQRDFAENLKEAGLLCDARGAGNASSRRESPSYVTGLKSPGWTYDSEKGNLNNTPDGSLRFRDDKAEGSARSRFDNINTIGHQLVMDDHPDFQGVRLRTSSGSQIYMNESCDQPFIYISTARGKVWIELVDDKGDINVFGEGSFSLHARKDINLVADRDMNIDVQRDLNVLVRRDSDVRLKGNVDVEFNKNDVTPQDLNYDPNPSWGQTGPAIGGNTTVHNWGSLDVKVGDILRPMSTFSIESAGDMNILSGGFLKMQSTLNFHMFSLAGLFISSVTGTNISSAGLTNITAGGGYNLGVGGTYALNAALVTINSSAPVPATPALPAEAAAAVSPLSLSPASSVPTDTEKQQCIDPSPAFDTLPGTVVPQHQPWPERCQQTIGLNGFISQTTTPQNRFGAITLDASAPISLLGSPNPGDPPGLYQALPYSGTSPAEAPQYIKIRDPLPGEVDTCSTFTSSDKLVQFLKQHEAVRNNGYLDAGGLPTIGIGHLIVAGDVIFGDTINGTVTREDVRQLTRDRVNLRISDEEIDRLFRLDLARFEKGVCETITASVTQDQFDAMVSLSYNIGNGAFARSSVAEAVNTSQLRDVPQAWMRWITVRGNDNRGLINRRRAELSTFWDSTNLVT